MAPFAGAFRGTFVLLAEPAFFAALLAGALVLLNGLAGGVATRDLPGELLALAAVCVREADFPAMLLVPFAAAGFVADFEPVFVAVADLVPTLRTAFFAGTLFAGLTDCPDFVGLAFGLLVAFADAVPPDFVAVLTAAPFAAGFLEAGAAAARL